MFQELVMAFDPDEALVIASELRPELPRPRVAILSLVTSMDAQ